AAGDLFAEGKFEIMRKAPKQVWSERRIVFDNDFQPKDLVGETRPRWFAKPEEGWDYANKDEPKVFKHPSRAGNDIDWLRYQHLMPSEQRNSARPELISDFMGYNSWMPHPAPGQNWVGDLLIECDVEVQQASGELVLELSKGVDRFRARWDLASG